MAKIGAYEEDVLEAELTVSLLERKAELIQAAVNRREEVDLDAIERQLIEERNERLSQLEASDATASETIELSDDEQKELRVKYRAIVNAFHPQVNTDITDTQRELYEKALDAYKRQSLDAMRLIYDMLFDTAGLNSISVTLDDDPKTDDEIKSDILNISDALTSDYTLAAKLFTQFEPLQSDAVILNASGRYTAERQALDEEIKSIRGAFPFSAQAMLRSEQKTADYIAELKVRMKRSEADKERLNAKITEMLGAARHG